MRSQDKRKVVDAGGELSWQAENGWTGGRSRRFCGSARTKEKLRGTLEAVLDGYSSDRSEGGLLYLRQDSCETYQMTWPRYGEEKSGIRQRVWKGSGNGGTNLREVSGLPLSFRKTQSTM